MTAEPPASAPDDSPGDGSPETPREAPPAVESTTGYVDLGALVLGGIETPVVTRMVAEDEHATPREEFTSVLSRFRASLNRNLAPGDARSHHDLGVAYRAMGLGQEAIGEFQKAVRKDPGNAGAYELLGRCFLDAGQPDLAANALRKALELPRRVDEDHLGMYYYLGRAHEEFGDSATALQLFRKAIALDIDFQDVAARYQSLRDAATDQSGNLEDHADAPGAALPPSEGAP